MIVLSEAMPSQFPSRKQSPFTIGDVETKDQGPRLVFRCTLYWNQKAAAKISSSGEPFDPLNWEWILPEAKPEFEQFLRFVEKFPTADLFIGSMIACYTNLHWLSSECQKDTLFRTPNDPPHLFKRVRKPFSDEVRREIVKRYGPDVYFFNEALPDLLN